MNFLYKIYNKLISPSENASKTIFLTNNIALALIIFMGMISIMGFVRFKHPIIGYLFLLNTLLSALVIFLNKYDFFDLSRYLLSYFLPIFTILGGAYAKHIGYTNNLILYLSPRILITITLIIPTLLFGYAELKKTIIAILPGFLIFVFYDKIHHLFGIYMKDMPFEPQYYPVYLVMILTFVIFMISSIMALQAAHLKYERIITDQNHELLASEEELKQQNEEILTINEHLEQSQKTIIEQKNDIELSKKRFESLLNILPEIVFETNDEGILNFVNPKFYSLTNFSLNDFNEGIYFLDLIQQEHQKQAFLDEFHKKGYVNNFEIIFTTSSMQELYFLCSVQSLSNLDNLKFSGILINVTERKKAKLELLKLNEAVKQSPTTIVITDKNGIIEYVNPHFEKLTGYNYHEAIGQKPSILKSGCYENQFYEAMWRTILSGKVWKGKILNKKKNGEVYWEKAVISPVFDTQNNISNFIAIKEDITKQVENEKKLEEYYKTLSSQNKIISEANRKITDSINYAKIIQQAVLPNDTILAQNFADYFILNKPKDIVGGDFYYFSKQNNYIYLAVADSTGHGVPGGFMTMLGISLLENIIVQNKNIRPSKVLNLMRAKLIETLGQDLENYKARDGIDMALCVFDLEKKQIYFSGANRPLILIRNNEIIQYRPNSMPVGMYHKITDFKEQEISITKNDKIYLFSDGITDQFGGEKNRKFSKKRFLDYLLTIENKSFEIQKNGIINKLETWKGELKQTDDMLCIGVKI